MAYGARDKMAIALVMVASCLAIVFVIEANSTRDYIEKIELPDPVERALMIDVDGAKKKFVRDVERHPENHQNHYNLARAFEKLEQWDEMAESLREATRLAPEFANYWWNLGQASMQGEKYNAAEVALRTCIERDPNFVECYHDLGLLNQRIENPRQALLHYVDAIKTDPRRGRSYVEAASLYFALRRYGEAEATAKAALALLPSLQIHHAALCELHELLADLALVRGDSASELAELQRGYEVSESVAPGHCRTIAFRLGYAHATMKVPNPARASALLTEFGKRQCSNNARPKPKAECKAAAALSRELEKAGEDSRARSHP